LRKDFKLLNDTGHFLKGGAASLGMKKVRNVCEEIQYANIENYDEIRHLLEKLKEAQMEAIDCIKKRLSSQ
jgi:HPt (histidine-containing phosphotransfer) domain-containing protein